MITNSYLFTKQKIIFYLKTITLGTALQPILYMLIIPQPPYPVIVLGFGIYGFACALQVRNLALFYVFSAIISNLLLNLLSSKNAQVNSFVARLKDPTKMAILHACYGNIIYFSLLISGLILNFYLLKWVKYMYILYQVLEHSPRPSCLPSFRQRNIGRIITLLY